jgi:outer membrane protein
MKKAIIAVFVFLFTGATFAQKYAVVDTKYILQNVPEYHEAQKDLDQLSAQWQTEIEQRHETINKLKSSLQAERVLLTEEMISDREEEITKKENEVRELQRKRFGVNGDLFKRRQELIQPIQDNIYEAIAEVASRSGYMVVFDKGINSNVLYLDTKFDLSDRILRRMGIRPGEGSDRSGGDGDDDSSGGDREKGETSPSSNPRSTPSGGRDAGGTTSPKPQGGSTRPR